MQRMKWETLLCPNRWGSTPQKVESLDETRTHFQRDYDRLIFSSPFRRLQNKTQVFPLPGSVFVHNRLTHSLEVASVGRSLGNNIVKVIREKEGNIHNHLIEEIPTIVSTACLAHDMGNPPFGHSGEDAIRTFFKENAHKLQAQVSESEWTDLIRFEGNANALRLLTQKLEGRREGGFRLSKAILATILKYPYPSSVTDRKKFGYFQSEQETFIDIATSTGLVATDATRNIYARHPLVYLVEAADDICYQIMDIEDAHKLSILSHEFVMELFLGFFDKELEASRIKQIEETLTEVTDKNEQIAFLRALVIGKLVGECTEAFRNSYEAIMHGEKVAALADQLSPVASKAMGKIAKTAVAQVYSYRSVVEIEIAGFKIMGTLLDALTDAINNPEKTLSRKIFSIVPAQYNLKEGSYYQRYMSMLDFVSGMTDVYALEFYRTIQGISIPGIPH